MNTESELIVFCVGSVLTLTVALPASDDDEGTSAVVSSGTHQCWGAVQRYKVLFSASVEGLPFSCESSS